MTCLAAALQRGRVTVVAGVTLAVETVLPAVVGFLCARGPHRPGFLPVAVLGLLLDAASAGSVSPGMPSRRSSPQPVGSPLVEPLTYAAAGVDVEAGDRAVELMKAAVARTHGPEVLGGVGGFAGLYDALGLHGRPAAAPRHSTDGVGTKVAVAQRAGQARHDRPRPRRHGRRRHRRLRRRAALHDRLHRLRPGRARADRRDRRRASPRACEAPAAPSSAARPPSTPGCSSPTSTTSRARRPASWRPTDVLGADRVAPGDVVVALASSGLHANGYSLVRRVCRPGRLGARPVRRGARPHARRGAARADPDLRRRRPRPGRGPGPDLHALAPRHRRRARRQPRPGAAGRLSTPSSTGRRGPGAGVRPRRPARRRAARRPRAHAEPRRRAWWPCSRRPRRRGRRAARRARRPGLGARDGRRRRAARGRGRRRAAARRACAAERSSPSASTGPPEPRARERDLTAPSQRGPSCSSTAPS